MGPAGFEPATSSAQGWHHTKLDNDPASYVQKHIDTYVPTSIDYYLAEKTNYQYNFKFDWRIPLYISPALRKF